MQGQLELVCVKCTRFALFTGDDPRDAGRKAEKKGWVRRNNKVICPKCPK